nr:hypothetical protein [Neokomagataea anthophila]
MHYPPSTATSVADVHPHAEGQSLTSIFGSVKAVSMDMTPSQNSQTNHAGDRLSSASFHATASNSAMIRTTVWSVCHFAFYLAQQIAELLAPLLLIIGIGWYLLPHIVGAITTSAANADPQARDIMNHVAGTIPSQLVLNGHVMTPGGLIFDGILLMGLAAIGATLSALSARNM